MFEYANDGILFLGGFALFGVLFAMMLGAGKAQHEGEKFTALPLFVVMLIITVAMIVHEGYDSKNRVMSNYTAFKNSKVIECSSLTTTYLVSKDRGWKRYEDGFTKDDILINVRSCNAGENND